MDFHRIPSSTYQHLPWEVLAKQTVYVLQSESAEKQHYVELTSNVVSRVAAHNTGESFHTRKYRPWRLVVAMEFANQERAIAFERYLKSGSGSAFLKPIVELRTVRRETK